MDLESVTKMVRQECLRLQKNKKARNEAKEADDFETAPDYDEIPIYLKKEIDRKLFFYDGPEVTVPADEFTFEF